MYTGGLGGIIGWASTYPIDVVKTIIQSDNAKRSMTMVDCFKRIFQSSGVMGMFNGLYATILRAFPTNVAILGTFHLSMMEMRKLGLIEGYESSSSNGGDDSEDSDGPMNDVEL
jgi:solute carrier family 25 carnitine/acylcarnitine transporter 20/29